MTYLSQLGKLGRVPRTQAAAATAAASRTAGRAESRLATPMNFELVFFRVLSRTWSRI